MAIRPSIDDARRAWEARDPILVDLIEAISSRPDPEPEVPIREGAPTFDLLMARTRTPEFLKKSPEEQRIEWLSAFKALEAPDAEAPLSDRLRLHELILALWEDGSPFARACLLRVIDTVALTYGPWRALKRIFKEAESRGDLEVFAALTARFDVAHAAHQHGVSRRTLAYMVRRAWRHLRAIGRMMPVAYPDVASAVLARYPSTWGRDRSQAEGAWVYNHILYHGSKAYTRGRFLFGATKKDPVALRAFPDSWRRSPRPLFVLLERARSDAVLAFATEALRRDFRASLREVEPGWVVRLIASRAAPVHEFVVWILGNVPKFEQSSFRELGLHGPVLSLFDSPSDLARSYAADYARAHTRDLPVDELVRLADNRSEAVRKLAADLLGERDPRKEVGLDAWGRLLESEYGHTLAAKAIQAHFGPKELTSEWFRNLLFSQSEEAFEFVSELLPKIHSPGTLGYGYFRDLLDKYDWADQEPAGALAEFAMKHLARFGPDTFDPEFLALLLIRPDTRWIAASWINEGRLKAGSVPIDALKAMAFHPDWDAHPLVRLEASILKGRDRELSFDEPLADQVLGWLGDVRRFSPGDLGFDWLLSLARRAEPRYHDFAVELMIKGFVPADFAPAQDQPASVDRPPTKEEVTVDLGGQSFLFTGKLATMQRKESEGKVRDAGGAVSSGVTAKLHYLVIGDEGSPLYGNGNGKKGSKQLKAEELNGQGANIRIISETAFLRMLSGRSRDVSADATLAGCERLWEMAVGGGASDARLGQFARKYIRRHHPRIALDETDRPVDPGAEIPDAFLGFDRVLPLFFETREPIRAFALTLARSEFGRWSPPGEDLVRLAEAPFAEVRRLVADALLADDAPEHRRYRIDHDSLSPAAVYRFCESGDEQTRALGLKLIDRSPRLRLPDELYRLTESPDRAVRAFVVRALWSLYRDRHITGGWAPFVSPRPTIGPVARKKAAEAATSRGTGPPARPDRPPAPPPSLGDLLRRMLFELPPGRPPRRSAGPTEGQGGDGFDRLRPLPNRLAKLAVVETLCDLAIEDEAFARFALPPLVEFLGSRGKSEHAACLVAVTRIRHAHPGLSAPGSEAAS
ncbi:BRCT domain-containing protein [Tautonia plasticadhaerens]|uniref:DNA polymerase III subunit epsilon n=1 Tax=Tautonia plasticadhaerens TaxID=2527974 RepID=A0A518H1R8_9BACT|nr:BRCT domain-containing protein [Tautonia plasticadhaerens]QDV34779.1 DNA polymerase III subunit epsilon [Tautonia plasticadhaerens]